MFRGDRSCRVAGPAGRLPGGGDRGGSVALWMTMAIPLVVGVVAMGVEASRWTVVRLDMQRIADAASVAGAANLTATGNATKATLAAGRFFELNLTAGGAGAVTGNLTTPAATTNATDTIGAANGLTYTVVANAVTQGAAASPNAIQVTASTSVPRILTSFVSSGGAIAISVASTAAAGTAGTSGGTTGGGGQPCVLLLGTAAATLSISTTNSGPGMGIAMPGCEFVSNGPGTLNTNSILTADAVYNFGTGGLVNKGDIAGNFVGALNNNNGARVTGTLKVSSATNASGATIVGNVSYSPPASNWTNAGVLNGTATMANAAYNMTGPGDPYASDSATTAAMAAVNAKTATGAVSCTLTALAGMNTAAGCPGGFTGTGPTNYSLKPGTTYKKIAVPSGYTATLPAGVYYIIGPITVTGTLTANNATLLVTNNTTLLSANNYVGLLLSVASGGSATLTGPTAAQVASGGATAGVAGMALGAQTVAKSTGFVTVAGNGTFRHTGLLYIPNARFSVSGASALMGLSNSGGCAQIIADNWTMTGSATASGYLGAGCASPVNYGLLSYKSWPGSVVTTPGGAGTPAKLAQ